MMATAMPKGMQPDDHLASPDMKLIADMEKGVSPEQKERITCSYQNNSDRFKTVSNQKEKAFKTQFASIYYQRLIQMTSHLQAAASRKWIKQDTSGTPPNIVGRILDLQRGTRCIIFGTVYKQMKLKPNILDEYHAREKYEAPPPVRSKYYQEDDSIILEDQSGRIALSGGIVPADLVSGVLMAVLGFENEQGDFETEDVCFCNGGAQSLPAGENDVFVALVSGLDVGSSAAEAMLPTQLFIDYITGHLGSSGEQECAAKIARVIIAGNLIEKIDNSDDDVAVYKKKGIDAKTVSSMAELDTILAHLTACSPVDIMAGPNDPSNQTLPQQPMHRCMFPKSASTGSLRGVTNPYDCDVNGINLIGTSGQNIDDVYRFSKYENRLEILECIHKWRHLFPTAPDTLGCFPFYTNDPFVTLEKTPHVLFAGNQPDFKTSLVEGLDGQTTRLICIPKFSTTKTIVMLNTKTLECYPVCFAGFDDDFDVTAMEE